MLLTTAEVESKLNEIDCSSLPKPGNNKGERGQILEQMLGIPNSSRLIDLIDGELKSFTFGESVAITQLKHCLTQIVDMSVEYNESKVYEKMKQTIYVAFSKNNEYIGSKTLKMNGEMFKKYAEDYSFIAAHVKYAVDNNLELNQLGFTYRNKPTHTITGPNNVIQIRTKASKNSRGSYNPLCYNGVLLNNKSMGFYLTCSYAKEII